MIEPIQPPLPGVPLPPRPRLNAPAIRRRVAETLAAAIMAQHTASTDFDHAQLIEDLDAAFWWTSDHDGYAIASYLERNKYYSPDAELVELLQDTVHLFWEAHEDAVALWVDAHAITPALTVGTTIQIARQIVDPFGQRLDLPEILDATITKIDATHATYTINVPALGHVTEGLGTYGVILAYERVESPLTPTPEES